MLSRLSSRIITTSTGSLGRFSTQVSAAQVKKLREISGAPLMDCKHALASPDVNGDIDAAIDWLRKKGIAKASSRGGEASEGLIVLSNYPHNNTSKYVLLEVNCETDFVSMNKDFQQFAAKVSDLIASNLTPATSSPLKVEDVLALNTEKGTVEKSLGDLIASIRESIKISRASVVLPSEDSVLGAYVHGKVGLDAVPENVQLGKSAAVITLGVSPSSALTESLNSELSNNVARRLAMHAVAARPIAATREGIPQDFIDREMAIIREQTVDPSKKPEMLEKIITGKFNKRLSEVCLVDQAHMAEEGNPVVNKFLDEVSKKNQAKISVKAMDLWSLKK